MINIAKFQEGCFFFDNEKPMYNFSFSAFSTVPVTSYSNTPPSSNTSTTSIQTGESRSGTLISSDTIRQRSDGFQSPPPPLPPRANPPVNPPVLFEVRFRLYKDGYHCRQSGKVYSIQHYVIKFVSDLRQINGFLWVLCFPPPIKICHDITEILLKVELNTITLAVTLSLLDIV